MSSAAVEVPSPYRLDWRYFTDWCAAHDVTPLPCDPSVVARFIAAENDVAHATSRRRVAAINAAHRSGGFPVPGTRTAVRRLLSLRDHRAAAARLVLPQLPVQGYPAGLLGRRDALVLWLVCVLGFSPSAIATLQRSDLTCDGEIIRIGGGHDVEVPVDRTDPFGLLPVWRRWASIQSALERVHSPVGLIVALDNAKSVDPDEPPRLGIPRPPRRDQALVPAFRLGMQWKSVDPTAGLSAAEVRAVLRARLSAVQEIVDDTVDEGADTFSDGTVPHENPEPPQLSTDYYEVGMAKRRKGLRQLQDLNDLYDSLLDQSSALDQRLQELLEGQAGSAPEGTDGHDWAPGLPSDGARQRSD